MNCSGPTQRARRASAEHECAARSSAPYSTCRSLSGTAGVPWQGVRWERPTGRRRGDRGEVKPEPARAVSKKEAPARCCVRLFTASLHRTQPAMPGKQAAEITDDEAALVAVCGSEAMAERVKILWADIMEKKRLDVSDQGLNDDGVVRLLKGLHMCAARLSLHLTNTGISCPTTRSIIGAALRGRGPIDHVHRRVVMTCACRDVPLAGCRRRQVSRRSAPSPFRSRSSTSRATRSLASASAPWSSLRARRDRTRRSSTSQRTSWTTRPRRRR